MKLSFISIIIMAALLVLPSCKNDDDKQMQEYYQHQVELFQKQLETDKGVIKEYLESNEITCQEYCEVFYEVIEEGEGKQCQPGNIVDCKYKLTTVEHPDKVIDQSGDKVFTTQLAQVVPSSYVNLIPGFQIALVTLKEGGKSRFYIPSVLGYGERAMNGEKNANLIFEIELCKIYQ